MISVWERDNYTRWSLGSRNFHREKYGGAPPMSPQKTVAEPQPDSARSVDVELEHNELITQEGLSVDQLDSPPNAIPPSLQY